MSDLLALAGRCEAATLDPIELNCLNGDILRGIGWTSDDRDVYDPQGNRRSGVPSYTTSVDAAMDLVPEGAGFNLDRYWVRDGVRWRVEISTGGIPSNPRKVFDCWDARSSALATAAAALRARAAMTPPARPLCGSLGDEM